LLLRFVTLTRFQGIKCIAHRLDGLLKASFKIPAIEALFLKQRKAIKYMRKSNKANRRLRDRQLELHLTTPNPFDAFHINQLSWQVTLSTVFLRSVSSFGSFPGGTLSTLLSRLFRRIRIAQSV
jgi:hypothetical protein